MKIHWDDRSPAPIPAPVRVTVKQAAAAAVKRFGAEKDCEVSISLVCDEEMRALNNRYRAKDSATDVLSFPAPKMPRGISHLGDIVISAETAARQAAERSRPTEHELAFLTIHGILHLLGLDHETSARDEILMNEIQDEVMIKIFG